MLQIRDLRVSLEFPVDTSGKWAREFPPTVCTIGVHEVDPKASRAKVATDMAAILELWRRNGEFIFAYPQEPFFGSEKKLRGLLNAPDMTFNVHLVSKTEYVFQMSDRTTLALLLERCECSLTILLFSPSVSEALETFRYVFEEAPKYRSDERAFMDRLSVHDGIVSCAVDHYGIIAIGTPGYAFGRCFRPVLPLLEAAYAR